jgi:hypothetical protein
MTSSSKLYSHYYSKSQTQVVCRQICAEIVTRNSNTECMHTLFSHSRPLDLDPFPPCASMPLHVTTGVTAASAASFAAAGYHRCAWLGSEAAGDSWRSRGALLWMPASTRCRHATASRTIGPISDGSKKAGRLSDHGWPHAGVWRLSLSLLLRHRCLLSVCRGACAGLKQ